MTAAYEAVRKALLTEWDPIGIHNIPEAQDEYDSYVGDIYNLLVNRSPKEEIFLYLWNLETQHMGLNGDRLATERFAKRLLQIAQEINNPHG